jgi:hypothetical protein
MAHQIPKQNHPWRKYSNRTNPSDETNSEKKQKSVKILIQEFANSWDEIRIVTSVYGREGEFKLSELSQSKQAAWLAGLLKRHYA